MAHMPRASGAAWDCRAAPFSVTRSVAPDGCVRTMPRSKMPQWLRPAAQRTVLRRASSAVCWKAPSRHRFPDSSCRAHRLRARRRRQVKIGCTRSSTTAIACRRSSARARSASTPAAATTGRRACPPSPPACAPCRSTMPYSRASWWLSTPGAARFSTSCRAS